MCHPSEYSCGCSTHHTPWRASHHHWGCCCASGYPFRRFPTREEVIAQFEEYLKNLQAEAKGLEEHIAELKKSD